MVIKMALSNHTTSPLADVLVWAEANRPDLLPLSKRENLAQARVAFAAAMASGTSSEKKARKPAEAQEYVTLVLWGDGTYSFCGTGAAARGLGDSEKKLNEAAAEMRILEARKENPDVVGIVISIPSASVAGFPFPSE